VDTGAFKGLELILIVGAVGWFYVSQMGNLKRLREERETDRHTSKPKAGVEHSETEAP
jgi:hypothetical protein